jgi:hypothetical protein
MSQSLDHACTLLWLTTSHSPPLTITPTRCAHTRQHSQLGPHTGPRQIKGRLLWASQTPRWHQHSCTQQQASHSAPALADKRVGRNELGLEVA